MTVIESKWNCEIPTTNLGNLQVQNYLLRKNFPNFSINILPKKESSNEIPFSHTGFAFQRF